MAETISGGATLRDDGKTWQDADGRPLPPEKQAEAEEARAAVQRANFEAEQKALQSAALQQEQVRRFLLGSVPAVTPASAEEADEDKGKGRGRRG